MPDPFPRLSPTPGLTLLPIDTRADAAALDRAFDAPTIYAADWYVDGIERGVDVPGGYAVGRVVNVDHHADTERMRRPISSTPLALERLRAVGRPHTGDAVVLTHTDCDSVLCAGILLHLLPADGRLGAAAIAADHTGAEDPLADALQAVDHRRDWGLSLELARRVLDGREIRADLAAAINQRRAERERAADVAGRAHWFGRVACIVAADEVSGEFFPLHLPAAAVVMLASPRPGAEKMWNVKLRLGNGVPLGSSLFALAVQSFDANLGGRWNAASNKRQGGTTIEPVRYAEQLANRVAEVFGR